MINIKSKKFFLIWATFNTLCDDNPQINPIFDLMASTIKASCTLTWLFNERNMLCLLNGR